METVIGAFEDRATAQNAVEQLMRAGFDRSDLHLEASADGSAAQQPDSEQHGVFASIENFFDSLFGEGDDQGGQRARTYAEAVRRGSCVVVVDASDPQRAERAATLLHELGAVNVDERAQEWRAQGWNPELQGAGTARTHESAGNSVQPGQQRVMDVVQEELQVGKRTLDRGGVRVIQRVSDKPVRELVQLRAERAIVERRPVDRPATNADLANFKDSTVEVRETAEEPVVAKSARVVEEVRVGKQVEQREQEIEDTVRRKDVDVERMEGGTERERATAAGKLPRVAEVDKPTPSKLHKNE